MNLDPGYLFASMIVSGIGFVLFKYGRGQRRVPHTAIGFILMLYPYVVSSVLPMVAIGAGLCALLWVATLVGM